MCRHGTAVPKYFHVVNATIFVLVPTPTCDAICAGSFDVPADLFFFSIRNVVQVASNFHENGRAHGVEVFGHCFAMSAHGSVVEKHSVSSASLLRAQKRMSRVRAKADGCGSTVGLVLAALKEVDRDT